MEWIDFKAGKQVAGTIVKDMYGNYWTVLKNIANATAQPREGAYYTRYLEPVVVVPEIEVKYLGLHTDDFYIEQKTVNGVIEEKIRIKPR